MAAQGLPSPPHPQLSSDVRGLLIKATGDSSLEPWQRELMLELARVEAQGPSAEPVAELQRLSTRFDAAAVGANPWATIPPPSRRYLHTAFYDPVRDRMVVFGGFDGISRADVWTLTFSPSPVWSALNVAGTPPAPRYGATAIYDPVRDRAVLFGGSDGLGYRNDIWALSLADSAVWIAITPKDTVPSARYLHTAIYDPVRDRMIVFGGYGLLTPRPGGSPAYLNDLWELSLSGPLTWRPIAPADALPSGRYLHSAIYDPVRDAMVVFGGVGGSGYSNQVWALSLSAGPSWGQLTPTGTPPAGRYLHTALYDPVRDRMILYGGKDAVGLRTDVWALALSGTPAWSELTPSGAAPSARYGHTAIYDPARDQMVAFGGDDGGYRSDAWALSLAGSPAWSAISVEASSPSGRCLLAAIYDPVRDRMVVFGGLDGGLRNDVWALSLAGDPAWSALAPNGTLPSPRYNCAAIYDPVRDRMVVLGGSDAAGDRNDVWALSLSGSPAWSEITAAGGPTARHGHAAIYDPVGDRVVVFGGYGLITIGSPPQSVLENLNDVWALSLSGGPAWDSLFTTNVPPSGRFRHTAIYDVSDSSMVVFGGYDGSRQNDAWALSLSDTKPWNQIVPLVPIRPIGRMEHTTIYDPVRDRMVVFGGYDGARRQGDTWALPLTPGAQVWATLPPDGTAPTPRFWHTAIYDPVRDRMVVFGGWDGSYRNDLWTLTWGTPGPIQKTIVHVPQGVELAPPRPNPSRAETFVDFKLETPARVVVDVFDVRGRRVKRIADDQFAAGPHGLTWRGDDERGLEVGSGLYFIRLQRAGYQTTRRAVRIR